MRKILSVLLAAVLLLAISSSSAEDSPILGNPFPDFTVRTAAQQEFTLSEALQTHEAVLINLWASWCGPCIDEFPYLNEVYAQYGDRVEIIGLTIEPEDTWNVLWDMQGKYGMRYPIVQEAGTGIMQLLERDSGTPTTIIVDRFGNAVYYQLGAFTCAADISRVLDAFLGEDYTESRPLTEIPLPAETRALPLSAARRIIVENEDARRILIHARTENPEIPEEFRTDEVTGWIVPGDTARLVLELQPGDDLTDVVFFDDNHDTFSYLYALLDPARGAYTYALSMVKQPLRDTWNWVALGTKTGSLDADPAFVELVFFPDEASVQDMIDYCLEDDPYATITWEYADEGTETAQTGTDQTGQNGTEQNQTGTEQTGTAAENTYILHATDQYGNPVPGVTALFCTDSTCVMAQGDADGTITFTGEPFDYHVKLLKVPEGYSFDADFEFQAGAESGEWILVVRKD